MTNLREGRIQAFLDDEMSPPERAVFAATLETNEELAEAVRLQAERKDMILELLKESEGERLDVESHLELFKTRLSHEGLGEDKGIGALLHSIDVPGIEENSKPHATKGTRRSKFFAVGLGRAAALILLASGAVAAAVPGSPVRSLFSTLIQTDAPTAEIGAAQADGLSGSASSGVSLAVPEQGMIIRFGEIAEPHELRIFLVDGEQVEILGGRNTSYTTASGHVDIHNSAGPMTIRIPRGASSITIEIDGVMVFEKRGGSLNVQGERTNESEFVIAIGSGLSP